jgi:hypothetical protein
MVVRRDGMTRSVEREDDWREEIVVCMWYNEIKQVGGEWERQIGNERNVTRESTRAVVEIVEMGSGGKRKRENRIQTVKEQ